MENKNILIGTCGGIAIYKILNLISMLKKMGNNVKVIMTEHAMEFVKPITFEAISGEEVYFDNFRSSTPIPHIDLAKWADVFLIAPATANVIAKMANGIADDLLTTTYAAKRSKVIVAPAMNTFMLNSPANLKNLKTLESYGITVLPTESDILACGDRGEGKLLNENSILEAIEDALTKKDLKGMTILVTAGPTREPLDPVRFLSNRSTGKMGYAIAKRAKLRGAKVILVSGITNIKAPAVDKFVEVESASDMFEAVKENFDVCDVLIKSAAVADYTPKEYHDQKIKKRDVDMTKLELKDTVDILKHFGNIKGEKTIVGFAAESQDIHENAKKKLKEKNLDLIVVNNIKKEGAGFGTDTNIVSLIDENSQIDLEKMSKLELADKILDRIVS